MRVCKRYCMFTLIKNAIVYAPTFLGKKDILLCGDKIVSIEDAIDFNYKVDTVIDACEHTIIPGIIDQHIHILGGGGEGSFKTRVPEIQLGDLLKSGITTVVGLLGTDATTRSIENLLAKTKALNEEGINAYCLTGAYEYPSPTLTGTVKKDITFIKEIIGAKLAISDHRAPLLCKGEFKKLASNVRVAGLLCGKNAYITLHMGDGEERFSIINEIVEETDIPIDVFRPTHVGRNKALFLEALAFAKKGGKIDITVDLNYDSLENLFGEIIEKNIPLENISMSSDGNGSWSEYDDMGKIIKIGAFPCDGIYREIKKLVQNNILSLEQALSLGTSNVADFLGLHSEGCIQEGNSANLLIIDDTFNIHSVIANGIVMLENNNVLVKGTFE